MKSEYLGKKFLKYLPLSIILGFAAWMRLVNIDNSFIFEHDQDLYSWIAKDILINRHLRLVGQITSVDGVFIGPLYYYLMAFVYAIFGMQPLSAVLATSCIGLATVGSFYVLGVKYFSKKTGLILALIYAVSWGAAAFDRWSVPTEPTVLWTVWFLYLILGMRRGNLKLVWLYGLLVGLIYHIHIALAPIAALPLIAYLLSKGSIKDKVKNIRILDFIIAIGIFFVVSSPFWLFEFKHQFSQIKSVIVASGKDFGYVTGWQKLDKVVNASAVELNQRLWAFNELNPVEVIWLFIGLMLGVAIFAKKIDKRESGLMLAWLILIAWAQFVSKRLVSEYYFTNILPVIMVFVALALETVFENRKLKYFIYILGAYYIVANTMYAWDKTSNNTDSLKYKSELVSFIKNDMESKGFSCVGINYIARFGTGVGFRYLFWQKDINVIKPSGEVPTYNIVIPWETSASEIDAKFGRFGIILPNNNKAATKEWCEDAKNQLDPMLGYTD